MTDRPKKLAILVGGGPAPGINSVIGAYYYLRVIIAMYFWEPSKEYVPTKVAPSLTFALAVAAIGTLYLGVLPARVLELAKAAADSIYIP